LTFINNSGIIESTLLIMENKMELQINIKKVANGFVVELDKETIEEAIQETHVFTRYSQVVKFLKENFNGKE
jgi:hypothetical protein